MTSRYLSPEDGYQLQKEFDTTFDRISKAFLKKMNEMIPSHDDDISEEYKTILNKELGNMRQLMASHMSLITDKRRIKDGKASLTYRCYDLSISQ
jgi:hypothetical protein